MAPVSKDGAVVVVGAGVFGLSIALELKKRGYLHVTVLDRFLPPVPDGSSVDISRVIRVEYADPLYAQMANEALKGWQTEYSNHFTASGFVMIAKSSGQAYMQKAKEITASLGGSLKEYKDAEQLKQDYPAVQADLQGFEGYLNRSGGWADAASSISQLARECSLAGVSFVTGARGTALSLKQNKDGRVVGVDVAEGPSFHASTVIMATGAWSNRLVPMGHATSASGQPVGFVQLTAEESQRLHGMPVIINLESGVFVFPPTPGNHILKVARHGYGFGTNVEVSEASGTRRQVSSPRLRASNATSGYLPEDADKALRDGLRQLVPEFAERPWLNRRLCWYSDTPDGDFVVDYHPNIRGLFLATGGAGHAFKFLPVLGRYTADCFENKASPELRRKWRLRQPAGNQGDVKIGDGSRAGPPLRILSREEQAKL